MQHEKYTSQLQLTIKALEAKAKEKQQLQGLDRIKGSVGNVKVLDRAERRANSLTGTRFCPAPIRGQRTTGSGSSLRLSQENPPWSTFSRATEREKAFHPGVQCGVTPHPPPHPPTKRLRLLSFRRLRGVRLASRVRSRGAQETDRDVPELAGRVCTSERWSRGEKSRLGALISVRHALLAAPELDAAKAFSIALPCEAGRTRGTVPPRWLHTLLRPGPAQLRNPPRLHGGSS